MEIDPEALAGWRPELVRHRLDGPRGEWFEAARGRVSRDHLKELVSTMVETPSPTGDEAALADLIAARLRARGIESNVDTFAGGISAATASVPGDGTGPAFLLYAPIDTHLHGDPNADIPVVGDALRFDSLPEASHFGDLVIGLGASNPKGQAACIVAAAEALVAAGIPLKGELQLGFGGGGMPVGRFPPPAGEAGAGHGVGCAGILDQRFSPDVSAIVKPSKGVFWEETGLAWLRVSVHGAFSYAGTRHRGDYDNPILAAPQVIAMLEEFFREYTATTTRGQVAPQANITAVHAGWTDRFAFVPARCDIYVDLRLSPHESVEAPLSRFESAVRRFAHSVGLTVETELLATIPGTRTEERAWIVDGAVAAWQQVEGAPHVSPDGTSGTTDAHQLRTRGIPTVRLGTQKSRLGSPLPDDFSAGMNTVDVTMMERLTAKLLHMVIDTCTRTRDEVAI